jgi:hypothetical protein
MSSRFILEVGGLVVIKLRTATQSGDCPIKRPAEYMKSEVLSNEEVSVQNSPILPLIPLNTNPFLGRG